MNSVRRILAFAALLLVWSATATAQNLKIEQYTLPNGLRVVLNEDHSTPLVAVNIWYHVGSKNEKPGRTGFAHLFEHMLFSGSQNVGRNEHFKYVQSVGGILNGSTSFDRTNYYETVPSNYLPLALWLEADRMGFFLPALDQEKLNIQKEVVKEERRQRYDNVPYGTWIESLLQRAFPADYPYYWPTIGSMTDLTAAELEDVKGFFRTYYSPNNAVLTLVGDFDPAEAREFVQRYFADIPRGPEVPRFNTSAPPLKAEQRDVVEWAVQLPRVYRLYHIPKFGDKDWIAADLLSNVLAGGKASRLEKALVYDQQIAQDVVTFAWPSETTGMFVVWATAKEGVSIERLEAALDTEIQKVVRNGVTEAELRRARNQVQTAYAQQLSEFATRADLINNAATFFNDPTLVNRWLDRYASTTRGDVQSVVSRYFLPTNRVTVHFVPKAKPAAASASSLDNKGGSK